MTVYFLVTYPIRRGKSCTVQAYAHFAAITSETKTTVTFIDETGRETTMKKADILSIEKD